MAASGGADRGIGSPFRPIGMSSTAHLGRARASIVPLVRRSSGSVPLSLEVPTAERWAPSRAAMARTEQYWLAAVRLSVICGRGAAPNYSYPGSSSRSCSSPGSSSRTTSATAGGRSIRFTRHFTHHGAEHVVVRQPAQNPPRLPLPALAVSSRSDPVPARHDARFGNQDLSTQAGSRWTVGGVWAVDVRPRRSHPPGAASPPITRGHDTEVGRVRRPPNRAIPPQIVHSLFQAGKRMWSRASRVRLLGIVRTGV